MPSALTASQEKTAKAIVNIFETGEVLGNYGSVTLIPGDTGRLTFGRSQTTLDSGNLFILLKTYCENEGARFGARLSEWLPSIDAKDDGVDTDKKLHNVLRASADDPIMRDTQDQFFDKAYWQPAARNAANNGVSTALGMAVIYDSVIHGSWVAIRKRVLDQIGPVESAGERVWISTYVQTRKNWLATSSRSDLRRTVYRMETFEALISHDNWGLNLPLAVRGREISLESLSATPPGCYSGPQPGTRILALTSPLLRGLDVRLVQLGLSDSGVGVTADGIYGQATVQCVRDYQKSQGLPVTGVVDIDLIGRLVD